MRRESRLRGCCLLSATRRRKPSHYRIKAKLRGEKTNKHKNANHSKSVKQMAAMHFLKIIINGTDQLSVSPPSGQDTEPHQSSDGQRDRGAADAPRGSVNSPHTCCTKNHHLFIHFWGMPLLLHLWLFTLLFPCFFFHYFPPWNIASSRAARPLYWVDQ